MVPSTSPSALCASGVGVTPPTTPPIVVANPVVSPTAPPATESYDPVKLGDELLAKAVQIFGAAEVIHLNPEDKRPLGPVLEHVRNGITKPYARPIIGVPCGSQSNLCALMIDLDTPANLESMLKGNEWLHDTVWTLWKNWLMIWVRIDGWRPTDCALPFCFWVSADGLLPAAEVAEPKHHPTEFPIRGKGMTVLAVKFDQFAWPPDIKEKFLLQRVESVHGTLFQMAPKGRVILGDATAARFFTELLKLSYSRNEDCFSITTDGKTELLPKAKLNTIISEWLRARAAEAGIPYPPNDSPVALVVGRLKRECALEQIDEGEGMQLFVTEGLELKTSTSITTSELYTLYREFCQARNAVCFPERQFFKRVTPAIRARLGLSKNHCVKRSNPDGSVALKYGWRNLAVKGARGAK